jgi:(R)-2-hydroxyacyl-CoA dehydratese activating ATPase
MTENRKIVRKKIGVIGMGPVGGILAVKLKEAGWDVSICVRNKIKLNKIRNHGLKLEGVFESTTHFDKIYGSIGEMMVEDFDYLVFALKSYQIAAAVEEVSKANPKNLTVISAQNGIDVEELLVPVFGSSAVLRMIINYAGNHSAQNAVRVSFFTPPNYIGSIDDSREKEAEEFAETLNSVELHTKNVDSFETLKRSWEKTILNSSLSALCGVGRLTMAEAMADEDTLELIEQIINEAVTVAEAEKIYFPDNFIRHCIRYLKKGGNHFPSLAGDLINNRQTEIDYFNGKIVEYGKKHYLRTSLNLAFTNMVKAMTNKNIISRIPGVAGTMNKQIVENGLVKNEESITIYGGGPCFLGVDLGSAYIKFTVIDSNENVVFRYILETLNKNRLAHRQVMQAIQSDFEIKYSCATGYGRKHFMEADIIKTEINCAAAGASKYYPGVKNIIDIGGEDIKVIHCDENDLVINFYMNDKCAAGTGSFLSEISERAQIEVGEMSDLAEKSDYNKELNSFCTVFAKTEIMKWIFEGTPIEDISRGIYLSVANKVAKMRLVPDFPTIMIGGVIAKHPYLKVILEERFKMEILSIDEPQHIVSLGAALIAKKYFKKGLVSEAEETEITPLVS